MKILIALIRKEFLQILRNKIVLRLLFIMPVVQIIILSYCANFDIKNVDFVVIDNDRSSISKQLISKLDASKYFNLTNSVISYNEALSCIRREQADVILEIPAHFENDALKGEHPRLSITANGANSMKANMASSYMNGVIIDFAMEKGMAQIPANIKCIEVTSSNWFNPMLDYKNLITPGIVVMLVTLISLMLSAFNIVREKEMGTIEQINVTPIRNIQFIIGKLFPFWIIALVEMTLGLVVAKILFNIPMEGSLWLLLLFAMIYSAALLGFGFLISTIANTQTQAMFITLFFVMLFILLSGLFTPVESMPDWAQKLNVINPIAYFVQFIRLVLIKGSGLRHTLPQFTAVAVLALVSISAVVWRYKKVG